MTKGVQIRLLLYRGTKTHSRFKYTCNMAIVDFTSTMRIKEKCPKITHYFTSKWSGSEPIPRIIVLIWNAFLMVIPYCVMKINNWVIFDQKETQLMMILTFGRLSSANVTAWWDNFTRCKHLLQILLLSENI